MRKSDWGNTPSISKYIAVSSAKNQVLPNDISYSAVQCLRERPAMASGDDHAAYETFDALFLASRLHAERSARTTSVLLLSGLQAVRADRNANSFLQAVCTQSELLELPMISRKRFARGASRSKYQ